MTKEELENSVEIKAGVNMLTEVNLIAPTELRIRP